MPTAAHVPHVLRCDVMQRLLDDSHDEPTTTRAQRAGIIALAIVATGLIGLIAFLLGSWAYHVRLITGHEGRLARLVAKRPDVALVTQALENENSPLIAKPRSGDELERALAVWGGQRGGEIRSKAARAAQTRVFRSGEVVYFLFFDESGVLSDSTCVLQ